MSHKTFYLTKTATSLKTSRRLHKTHLTKKDTEKILDEIEKVQHFPKRLRFQILKNFYWIYDSDLTNQEYSRETLTHYAKLIIHRENAIKQYPIEHFSSSKNCHDNCFQNPKSSMNAIDKYQKYIIDPTTLKAQAYMFNSIESFKWPESYFRKFVEGFKKYREIIVNNEKIA